MTAVTAMRSDSSVASGSACNSGAGAWYLGPAVLAAASFLLLCALSLSPRPGSPLVAVFPPWLDASEVFGRVASAGLRPVRLGAFETIVVTDALTADDAGRLQRAGAWLVLDARVLASCLPSTS
jgi:hypothetical protein